MNFDLSEEQYSLQDTVRRFLSDSLPPQRLIRIYDRDEGLDRGYWKALADLGVAGILAPEEHGGLGLSLLDQAIVSEVAGYCGAPDPLLAHALATLAIALCGSEEHKRRWLPGLASGEIVASYAVAEQGDRWQPGQWRLAAANGRLTGSKRNVLFAADADLFLVGLAGGTFALVEKGAPGLTVEAVDGIDRTRRIGWLHFADTPCDALPGGAAQAARVHDAGLVLLAADAFGGASRAIDMTVEYAKQREQFGRAIATFQGVKHQIANIGTHVETTRGLYWYAAYAFDHRPEESARVAALAKALCTDRYFDAARAMIELHGGIGYTWQFHAQVWYKRAVFDRQYFGPPSEHRERAAALAGW
ncbi:MAG: acyl-CoA dehydrogenase family protein [Gammaproteobacteria bacterium]